MVSLNHDDTWVLPPANFRWAGMLLFFQVQQGTGLWGGGFALGLSSLQLGKRAESGYLVCPGLPEFIEDCKEGRRG